ncbi:MAG: serine/threonine protein kinase, partial [Planctomycetes bacterium]|nr:serine/threonine protein kinase [Planctomycetota bacterium]
MDQEERRGADPERQAGEDAQARPEAETARDPAAVAGADAAAAADPAADAATAAAAAAVRDADPAAAAAAAAADFEDGAQRDGFEVLAEEFTERLRRGEGPTVEEYAARRPELAGRIRDLFPAILTMERSKMREAAAGGERISLGASRPDRLGDFRIVREIGRGGMGIVYEAVQESLGRRVAVKVLPRTSLLDATHLRRFQREARTAAHLHHTNIVAIFGVGHHEGFHYYVMQYIDGVGLDQVLAELRRSDAADPSAAAASLAGGERGAAPADSRLVRATTRRIREDRLGLDRPASGRIETEPADEAAGEAVEVDGVHASDHGAGSRLPSDAADAESGDGTKAARSPSEGPPGAESRSDGSPPSSPSAEPEAPSSSPRSSTGGKLGRRYWQAVARIGRQVAAALEHAHAQGILHRDVKPGNLLLDEAGVVWVTDFGLAKAMEQDGVSQTGDIVGTLGYMAPEQLSGRTDARSDIYSLGLTLYELLTLRPAYADTSRSRMVHDILHVEPPAPRKIRPEIPADLETIVVKSIAREPGHRYQSAGELAD